MAEEFLEIPHDPAVNARGVPDEAVDRQHH